jgi:membrane complex biogenesis BtpA family protein
MQWIRDTFGTNKPVIAMCHIRALPGDPYYACDNGVSNLVELARQDLHALQDGGVDAVMFSNEFSLPYLTNVRPASTATMARIIGELMQDIKVPFGVNMLWDPYATLDLAAATGASFVREIMSGVYASDFGLWNNKAGEIVRHQKELGLMGKVKMLYNIMPESAVYLSDRDIADIAVSTNFNHKPDALLVSGLIAGAEADTQVLKKVKDALPDVCVFCNTGCNVDNIEKQLAIADGAIVGTTFKKEGKFENFVDRSRVKAFMDKVKSIR